MNIIKIGIYLTSSKKKYILWDKFVNVCDEYNSKSIVHGNIIELIDINESNYRTTKFNKILIKLDEFYIENNVSDNILLYLTSQSNLIDPVMSQMNVGNRLVMADKLSRICDIFPNLFVPKYVYATTLDYSSTFADNCKSVCFDLSFPLICKPNAAFGSKTTHSMCIVKSYDDLINSGIQFPVLLQCFHEHDEIIFKVYVINNKVKVCIKNSISIANNEKSIINFDTADLKKGKCKYENDVVTSLIEELSLRVNLEELSKCISHTFGLTLFGYDMIKIQDNYAIIDVNYFPGFNGYPEFHNDLLNYFIDSSS